MNNIILNNNENYDGIVEKVVIDNNVKNITIVIKQLNHNKTHSLSSLTFNNVIFQSLPDLSTFNLIHEISKVENIKPVLKELNQYLKNNPDLVLSNTEENISNTLQKHNYLQSYLFESGYCKNWFIICENMTLTENKT